MNANKKEKTHKYKNPQWVFGVARLFFYCFILGNHFFYFPHYIK
jgi:hypothetical protein